MELNDPVRLQAQGSRLVKESGVSGTHGEEFTLHVSFPALIRHYKMLLNPRGAMQSLHELEADSRYTTCRQNTIILT